MERIQSAIQKARKARSEVGDPVTDGIRRSSDVERAPKTTSETEPNNNASTRQASGQSDRESIWNTVPKATLSPEYLTKKRVISHRPSSDSNPYDLLRTKLRQSMKTNDWRRVAITSASSGCGKSTICSNLAFSLARNNELRVMVVELDMRRPGLSKILGLDSANQFSRVLSGADAPEAHMTRVKDNLIFATNRIGVDNAAEILHGVTAAQVLDDIEATFDPDIMVFDTSPLLSGDDTLAFLDQVDCALLVVEAEKSTNAEVDKCERELSDRTNFAGILLNKCRYMESHENYNYQYSG